MPLTVLLALSLPLTVPTDCPNPVALDAERARLIASREIAARETAAGHRRGRFILQVGQDGEHRGAWRVWQERLRLPEQQRAMRGGGGITMRIDRCTGAVSDLHYQR